MREREKERITVIYHALLNFACQEHSEALFSGIRTAKSTTKLIQTESTLEMPDKRSGMIKKNE